MYTISLHLPRGVFNRVKPPFLNPNARGQKTPETTSFLGTVAKYPKNVIPANAGIYNILYLLRLQIPAFARMTDVVYSATVPSYKMTLGRNHHFTLTETKTFGQERLLVWYVGNNLWEHIPCQKPPEKRVLFLFFYESEADFCLSLPLPIILPQ